MNELSNIPKELQSFRAFIESDQKLTIVVFTAADSGATFLMQPGLKAIERTYADRLNLIYLDAPSAEDFIATYKICQIPTLLFFFKGKMLDCVPGISSKYVLMQKIDEILTSTG